MPLLCKHLVLRKSCTSSAPSPCIEIACSTPGTIFDELVALDSSADGMQSVFGYSLSDKQLMAAEACQSYLRNADGSLRDVPDDHRKLWRRNAPCGLCPGTCLSRGLVASPGKWAQANKAGLSLEHVMDAIAMADFELVSSNTIQDSSGCLGNYVVEYIFRRAPPCTNIPRAVRVS